MLVNIRNAPKFHLRASIFQKFPGGHAPDPYHWQAMHSDCVLHNIVTHNQKLLFNCVTMPDLEHPLESCLWV